MKFGRCYAGPVTVPQWLVEAVRYSASAVIALKRPVNPVGGLAGAGCIPLLLINVDRGSCSTVGFPKRV